MRASVSCIVAGGVTHQSGKALAGSWAGMSVRELSSIDGEKSGLKFQVALPFPFSGSCSVSKLLEVGVGLN